MEKSRLRKPAPTSVNVTVGRRSREYLTEREVERLMEAAKQNRLSIGFQILTPSGDVVWR
jgi:hypothetical protein